MKNKTFILLLAMYGLLFGGMMLFNATATLQGFGLANPDHVHIALIQYLGQTNIGLAVIAFLIRNTKDESAMKSFFLAFAFIAFTAELKGFYDIFIVKIATSSFSWIDTGIRLIIGFACLYFAMRKEKQ
jgi:hypothetical protein